MNRPKTLFLLALALAGVFYCPPTYGDLPAATPRTYRPEWRQAAVAGPLLIVQQLNTASGRKVLEWRKSDGTVMGYTTVEGNVFIDGTVAFDPKTSAELTTLGGLLSSAWRAIQYSSTDSKYKAWNGSAWVDLASVAGGVGGSGTSGTVPRWTASTTLGDSSIDDDGTNATATGNLTVTGNTTASGTLAVTGNTTLGGTLAVTGATTLTGAATANGSLTANAALNLKVVSKTSAYTAANESVILVDATSGAVTITLPAAASSTGRTYLIKKTDSGSNAVTLDGNASETIEGATTKTLGAQYHSVLIACDGTGWTILSDRLPAATGSRDGYLTATDWTTFNSKVSAEADTLATVVARGASAGNNVTMQNIFAGADNTYSIGDAGASFGTVYAYEVGQMGSLMGLNFSPSTNLLTLNASNAGDELLITANATGGFLHLVSDLPPKLTIPTASTVGAAGAASALPGDPVGYLRINLGGTVFKVPYWND